MKPRVKLASGLFAAGVAGLALLCGCVSGMYKYSVSGDFDDDGVENYAVVATVEEKTFPRKRQTMPNEREMERRAKYQELEDRFYSPSTLPVVEEWTKTHKYSNSVGVFAAWALTLGVFPDWFGEEEIHTLTVTSPIGMRKGTYSISATKWMGWLAMLMPIACLADEYAMNPSLPNAKLTEKAKAELRRNLVSEFPREEYAKFAKAKNEVRAAEVDHIKAVKDEVAALLAKNDYDAAEQLRAKESVARPGTWKCDAETWSELKTLIADAKEDFRVANKKGELEKLIGRGAYADVLKACESEGVCLTDSAGAEISCGAALERKRGLDDLDLKFAGGKYDEVWLDLCKKAYDAIRAHDREVEVARLEAHKAQVEELMNAKDYAGVIAACDSERGENRGSRAEDAAIWAKYRNAVFVVECRMKVDELVANEAWSDIADLCKDVRSRLPDDAAPEEIKWWTDRGQDAERHLAEIRKAKLEIRKSELRAELERLRNRLSDAGDLDEAFHRGDELIGWLKDRHEQTALQRDNIFSHSFKDKCIALTGVVNDIGDAFEQLWGKKTIYVSLKVRRSGLFSSDDVKFLISEEWRERALTWTKGSTMSLRGRVSSRGDLLNEATVREAVPVPKGARELSVRIKKRIHEIETELNGGDAAPPSTLSTVERGCDTDFEIKSKEQTEQEEREREAVEAASAIWDFATGIEAGLRGL